MISLSPRPVTLVRDSVIRLFIPTQSRDDLYLTFMRVSQSLVELKVKLLKVAWRSRGLFGH